MPDLQSAIPPFELLIVGSGWIEIPEELVHVVGLHRDLSYKDFYELVAGADIVVPAFADFGCTSPSSVHTPNADPSFPFQPFLPRLDFDAQASSTIALAAELSVPLLATARIRRTYGYIDDPRATVTRPAAMSEVQALRALRTRDLAPFLLSDPGETGVTMGENPRVRVAAERMVREG